MWIIVATLELNPIRMQDNFSQFFFRVSPLSRSPQRLLYAEFFFVPRRRRRGEHALIYVRISIYVRCVHPTAPRGSQAWTPQPPFVILMSHYIFVWAWAGETRSVKHVVTPVPPGIPSSRGAHPRDRGHCAHWKDFRRFGGAYLLGARSRSFLLFLSFQ